jgi:hypothetical protein
LATLIDRDPGAHHLVSLLVWRIAPSAMNSLWVAALMILYVAVACAHVNDRGMDYGNYKDRYGQSCCDVRDCRPADDFIDTVANGDAVVRLLIDGTWITVSRSYVVASQASDGRAHFCGRIHRGGSGLGDVKPEPTCVILPPRDT